MLITMEDELKFSKYHDSDRLTSIGAKADFCMHHYQPYHRKDFNLHHLSVITNIPETDIKTFFSQSPKPFDQYLDEFRVKYAKSLMSTGKVNGMGTRIIGALSGFSSARRFIEAFIRFEGISPEKYQSQKDKKIS